MKQTIESTQSKSITDTTNQINTTRKSTNTISDRTSIDNPFQSFIRQYQYQPYPKAILHRTKIEVHLLPTYAQRPCRPKI